MEEANHKKHIHAEEQNREKITHMHTLKRQIQ